MAFCGLAARTCGLKTAVHTPSSVDWQSMHSHRRTGSACPHTVANVAVTDTCPTMAVTSAALALSHGRQSHLVWYVRQPHAPPLSTDPYVAAPFSSPCMHGLPCCHMHACGPFSSPCMHAYCIQSPLLQALPHYPPHALCDAASQLPHARPAARHMHAPVGASTGIHFGTHLAMGTGDRSDGAGHRSSSATS